MPQPFTEQMASASCSHKLRRCTNHPRHSRCAYQPLYAVIAEDTARRPAAADTALLVTFTTHAVRMHHTMSQSERCASTETQMRSDDTIEDPMVLCLSHNLEFV